MKVETVVTLGPLTARHKQVGGAPVPDCQTTSRFTCYDFKGRTGRQADRQAGSQVGRQAIRYCITQTDNAMTSYGYAFTLMDRVTSEGNQQFGIIIDRVLKPTTKTSVVHRTNSSTSLAIHSAVLG